MTGSIFYGRKDELGFLDSVYDGRAMRTCAIYGRRRIGKSTLIHEFCSGKRSLLIEFINTSGLDNLRILSKTMTEAMGEHRDYSSLADALADIADYCREERTVIALDEYPYLVDTVPGASDELKLFIDRDLTHSESMLIICGSSISKLQDEISDDSRPLYGRFLRQLELGQLSYSECTEFHPGMSDQDRIQLYLTLGGVPEYHALAVWDTYRECISNLFLKDLAILSNEAENLINKELSPAGKHIAVLNAIAGGAVTLSEIGSRTGFSDSACTNYLANLRSIRLIDSPNPMLGAPKAPRYRISDGLVAFRHEVIMNYAASIGTDADAVFDELEPAIRTFLGKRFEYMCADFIRRNYVCKEIGQWWGKVDGEFVDIDVIAIVLKNRVKYTVFAECKFRNKPMGFGALNTLQRRTESIKGSCNDVYMLFSISGFEEDLVDYAEENGIILVDAGTLIGSKAVPKL